MNKALKTSAICFRKDFEEVLSRQPLQTLRKQLPKI